MERLRCAVGSFNFRCSDKDSLTFTATCNDTSSDRESKMRDVIQAKRSQENDEVYEIGILSGYRLSNLHLKDCFCSILQLHNETLNIWTQIIPAAYFLVQLLYSSDPFMILYLLTVNTLLISSASAHTFSCISSFTRHVCFFFDYSAITLYSSGCAVAYCAFSLPKGLTTMSVNLNVDLSRIYLSFSGILCVTSTYLSCTTRFWKLSIYMKFIRLFAFFIVWVYLFAPIAWRMVQCELFAHDSSAGECASMYFWTLQCISAVLAGLFYVSHFPERYFPGRFDIFAHSHQIFHVLGAIGAYNQFRALEVDLANRVISEFPPSLSLSLFCVLSVLAVNLIICCSFVKKLHSLKTKCA